MYQNDVEDTYPGGCLTIDSDVFYPHSSPVWACSVNSKLIKHVYQFLFFAHPRGEFNPLSVWEYCPAEEAAGGISWLNHANLEREWSECV